MQNWGSGAIGITPPELPLETSAPIGLVAYLQQEVQILRENGYQAVALGRRPGHEEYCIQVRVASDDENVSLHLVCRPGFPSAPPQLISTTEVFDRYGELVEQYLGASSPVIEHWEPITSLVVVVNDMLNRLAYAWPDGSAPSPDRLFDQYREIID
jgi:hypothetical protein